MYGDKYRHLFYNIGLFNDGFTFTEYGLVLIIFYI